MGNPALKDDFFLWTISEGGAQFGSDMPAYKGVLREDQIWEMITYMRAAFEGREASLQSPQHVTAGTKAR
jgi:mono/diheme cytochrome c family protein